MAEKILSLAVKSYIPSYLLVTVTTERIPTPQTVSSKVRFALHGFSTLINLESEELYAWTIVVVIMSVLIEKGVIRLLDCLVKKGGMKNVKTLED